MEPLGQGELGEQEPEAERVPHERAIVLTPAAMMELAIKRGGEGKLTDVAEVIERLTKLEVERQTREDVKELSRALAAARREFPQIQKNKAHVVTSSKGNYGLKWADLPSIAAAVDPILEKYGLSYSWVSELANGAAQLNVRCILRHENGQQMESQFPVPTSSTSGMSDQQRFASAQMFGRRKSLEQVLGLVIEDMPGDVAGEFDPTVVTPEQAANLAALIEETKSDKAKFLAIWAVSECSDLPARNLPAALGMLEQKRKRGSS